MKKAAPLMIGIIIFILLFAGYLFLKQKNAADAEVQADVLYSYSTDDITQFSFVDTDGETLSFTLSDDGWIYDASSDYEISEDEVTSLLSNVASMNVNNTLQDVSDLADYGLATPSNRVSFTAGEATVTIYIGDYNATTESQYIYLNDDTSVIYAVETDLTTTFQIGIDALVAEEETTEDTESAE